MKKYLLYAVGEILLIVFGILIALQVNTLNENRIRKNNEIVIYETIKDQLENYRVIVENDLRYNERYKIQFERANEIIESEDQTKVDTLGKIAAQLINYSDSDVTGKIYETLVNSGEIKILNNHRVVEGLRVLEERFLHINRIENIHYDAVMTHVVPSLRANVNLSNGEVLEQHGLYEADFQNLFVLALRLMYEKEEVYHATIEDIDGLIGLIDEELQSN